MPKCDLNKITLQHGCSPVNLLHIFGTLFPKSTSEGLFLNHRVLTLANVFDFFLFFAKIYISRKVIEEDNS